VQNTVVNFLKSEPGKPRTLSEYPGEYSFLGATFKPEVDVTPLDTAVRGLTSAGWRNAQRYIRSYIAEREQLERAALQAVLYKVTGPGTKSGGARKAFHFVCKMDSAVADHFMSTLNQLLEAQQAYCDAKGEELFKIPPERRAPLSPMFYRVGWWRIEDILESLHSEFVNDYQRREFELHGITERNKPHPQMEVLKRLCELTVESAFERAYRRERKLQAMEPDQRRVSKYNELEVCALGVDRLQVLSFNLNVLPFGVSTVYFGGGQHNGARLRMFLKQLKEALGQQEADSPRSGATSFPEHPEGQTTRFAARRKNTPKVRARLGIKIKQEPDEEEEDLDAKTPHDIQFIKKSAPDVIALQELFASPFAPGCCLQTYAIREMKKLGYTWHVKSESPSMWDLVRYGKWTDSGLVIFSRLPVEASKSLRFSEAFHLDAGACKGAIWARLQLAEFRFLDVFNCHLQASHTNLAGEVYDKIRHSQLTELGEFIKLAGSEHPFVLTGDFNVDAIPEPLDPMGTYGIPFRPPRNESEDYQRMVRSLDPTGRLVDLLVGPTEEDPLGGAAAASERRHPCTRPPRLKLPGSSHHLAKHKYPQRLDYVFYRPTLPSLVEHRHTHIDKFEVPKNKDFEHLSDHYGVRAHFRLRCGFAWRREPKRSNSRQISGGALRTAYQAAGSLPVISQRGGRFVVIVAILAVFVRHGWSAVNARLRMFWRIMKRYPKTAAALSAALSAGGFLRWALWPLPMVQDGAQQWELETPLTSPKNLRTQSGWEDATKSESKDGKTESEDVTPNAPSRASSPALSALQERGRCVSFSEEKRPSLLTKDVSKDRDDKEPNSPGVLWPMRYARPAARPSRTRTLASSPYDTFTSSVELYGGRRCIGTRSLNTDGTLGDYVWLTYRDTQREVLRISSGLQRKFGLKRNARVGLLGDASKEWLLCDIALMRCGADTVCLTAPSGKAAEAPSAETWNVELLLCSSDWLEYFLAPSREESEVPKCPIVTFKIVPPRLAAQAQHNKMEVLDLEFVAHYGEAAGWVPCVGFGAWEVMTTMYRSRTGSIGSKGALEPVSVTLLDVRNTAYHLAEALTLNCEDVHFSYAWPAFAAERVMLHAVLASGGAVGFFGGVRSPRIFEEIRRLGPTFLVGTPSLFKGQITRLRLGFIGVMGRLSFCIQKWALTQRARRALLDHVCTERKLESWLQVIANKCLDAESRLGYLLSLPFSRARATLLGPRTRLRFVLALCTTGSTALPPERCLWMRVMLGGPVYKGLVVVEAGGLVTFGEAPYFGSTAAEAFVVGKELPGVRIDLLPLDLPKDQRMSVCGSGTDVVEYGTIKVQTEREGLNEAPQENRVGIVCGKNRRGELLAFGRLVSLRASIDGRPALCEALEQLLVQVSAPWLMQLLLHADENVGVVGIAVVRLEELWKEWRHLEVEDLCKDDNVRAFCLGHLQRRAIRHGFAEWERPRALHLEDKPFSLEAGLQTPTFQLRRDLLVPRFRATIDQLYQELTGESRECPPSPKLSTFQKLGFSAKRNEAG